MLSEVTEGISLQELVDMDALSDEPETVFIQAIKLIEMRLDICTLTAVHVTINRKMDCPCTI